MAIREIAFCSTIYDYFIIEPLLPYGPVPRTSHLLLRLNRTTLYLQGLARSSINVCSLSA